MPKKEPESKKRRTPAKTHWQEKVVADKMPPCINKLALRERQFICLTHSLHLFSKTILIDNQLFIANTRRLNTLFLGE